MMMQRLNEQQPNPNVNEQRMMSQQDQQNELEAMRLRSNEEAMHRELIAR